MFTWALIREGRLKKLGNYSNHYGMSKIIRLLMVGPFETKKEGAETVSPIQSDHLGVTTVNRIAIYDNT